MSETVGDGILRGLEEALAFIEGTADESLYRVHIPPEIDVKAIRGRLGFTQQEFADRFGFNINTLRHWEQGRRVPDGPARSYLRVIDREPEAAQRALRIA
jgi:putative transcriptional regulator